MVLLHALKQVLVFCLGSSLDPSRFFLSLHSSKCFFLMLLGKVLLLCLSSSELLFLILSLSHGFSKGFSCSKVRDLILSLGSSVTLLKCF